jgi:hypothetical protein
MVKFNVILEHGLKLNLPDFVSDKLDAKESGIAYSEVAKAWFFYCPYYQLRLSNPSIPDGKEEVNLSHHQLYRCFFDEDIVLSSNIDIVKKYNNPVKFYIDQQTFLTPVLTKGRHNRWTVRKVSTYSE